VIWGKIMKVMKKKIIGLLVCTLMLSTIPLAAGMTNNTEPKPQPEPHHNLYQLSHLGKASISMH